MSALRATACGFSTLVVARLPLPQRLDCTGAASGGREHPEAPDLPEDVLALLDQHLLDLVGTYGEPNLGDPIQYDALRIELDEGDVEIVVYKRHSSSSRPTARRSDGFIRCAAGSMIWGLVKGSASRQEDARAWLGRWRWRASRRALGR